MKRSYMLLPVAAFAQNPKEDHHVHYCKVNSNHMLAKGLGVMVATEVQGCHVDAIVQHDKSGQTYIRSRERVLQET